MDEIRHVVVLMFENQSFDRLLGYLTLDDPRETLATLTGAETNPMSPPGDMTPIPVTKVSTPSAYVTDPGPGHDFEEVNQQLFGYGGPREGAGRIRASAVKERGPTDFRQDGCRRRNSTEPCDTRGIAGPPPRFGSADGS